MRLSYFVGTFAVLWVVLGGACGGGNGNTVQDAATCDPGWTGPACDTCAFGFHRDGDACALDQQCLPSTCSGTPSGTCSVADGQVACTCNVGYAGTYCESCASNFHRAPEGPCVANASIALTGGGDHDFGTAPSGTVTDLFTWTVTNTSTSAPSSILRAARLSNTSDFAIVLDLCGGQTLAPLASCNVHVRMASNGAPGVKSATLVVEGEQGGSATGTLSGTVATASDLTVYPVAFDFGDVQVGNSKQHQFLLVNLGGSAATSLDVSVPAASFLQISGSTCGSTLASLATCSFVVTATPSVPGIASGLVSATSSQGASSAGVLVMGVQ